MGLTQRYYEAGPNPHWTDDPARAVQYASLDELQADDRIQGYALVIERVEGRE